jgi:hypothetical protein
MKKINLVFHLILLLVFIIFSGCQKKNPTGSDSQPSPTPTFVTVMPPDSFEPVDNIPNSATAIAVGTPSTGHNFSNVCDWDWFSFNAISGQDYVIETYNLGADADTYLQLFASSNLQNPIAYNDDRCGYESYIYWNCPATGKYYVAASSYDCHTGTTSKQWTGIMDTSYSFRVYNVVPDTYEPDDSIPGTTIVVGAAAQSHNNHYADDMDAYTFNCTSGNQYTIQTSNLGANSDTVLRIYDSTGVQITYDDNSGAGGKASKIVWTADYTGTANILEFQTVDVDWSCGALGGTATAYSIRVTSP